LKRVVVAVTIVAGNFTFLHKMLTACWCLDQIPAACWPLESVW